MSNLKISDIVIIAVLIIVAAIVIYLLSPLIIAVVIIAIAYFVYRWYTKYNKNEQICLNGESIHREEISFGQF
jgi:Flp pilus assembly protein TadB